jgi:HdeA/HdeB family
MTSTRTILAAMAALVVVANPLAVLAQDKSVRAVEQYACKEVMRENGSNRDTAIAFLHGFLLGKSGGSEFNLEKLTTQTDAFIDRCLNNPNEKAMDAMAKVKG